MQATPSPSALAASEEVSRAPVCQGGRAHGVYAPAREEDASDAVHRPITFDTNRSPKRPKRHDYAHYTRRDTRETRAAAGSRPPPPTLSHGTSSPTQRTSEQPLPGPSRAISTAAQSSRICTQSRHIAPRLSSCNQQRLPIARGIDLRHENQTVNACKANGRSAQPARQGKAGARAG